MRKHPISWCTRTRNIQAGCTPVSPACKFCYAKRDTRRFQANDKAPGRYRVAGVADWRGALGYDEDWQARTDAIFAEMERAGRSHRTWLGSMTDLFHEAVPIRGTLLAHLANCIDATFRGGRLRAPQVLILLTKRPERMLAWQRWAFPQGLPPGVEVGTTAENQEWADRRIPALLQVDVAVRFVSCEPLLGPVDLQHIQHEGLIEINALTGACGASRPHRQQTDARLQLVIAGGESGPKARPTHPDWFRGMRDQCQEAGVAFHFKQHGEYVDEENAPEALFVRDRPAADATLWLDGDLFHGDYQGQDRGPAARLYRVGKRAAGRLLDGELHDALPPFPILPTVGGAR